MNASSSVEIHKYLLTSNLSVSSKLDIIQKKINELSSSRDRYADEELYQYEHLYNYWKDSKNKKVMVIGGLTIVL
jgi:hypothetical protein